MPSLSDAFETTKNMLIKKLRQIPDDILQELYSLDVINHRGKMQHNLWLADKYRRYRELSLKEGWLRFKIGAWTIRMETKD